LARRVLLVRVGRRSRSLPGAQDTQDGHSSRLGGSRLIIPADVAGLDVRLAAPVSPAPAGRAPGPVPLLPGDHTTARRLRFLLVQACTVGSLMLGMAAIFLSLRAEPRWAAACQTIVAPSPFCAFRERKKNQHENERSSGMK